MSNNPYTPPRARAALPEEGSLRPSSKRFPWGLVFRWIASIALIAEGLRLSIFLLRNWSFFSERAVIDPYFHPFFPVLLALLLIPCGALFFYRSKWSPALVSLQLFGSIIYFYLSSKSLYAPIPLLITWTVEGLILWFSLHLWAHGRLR